MGRRRSSGSGRRPEPAPRPLQAKEGERNAQLSTLNSVTTGRLHPREKLENQKVEGHSRLSESGLWFVSVHHEGNQNASAEEVERIARLFPVLCKPM
jgi:hypothetical protein